MNIMDTIKTIAPERNPYRELLTILYEEELIRFRRRSQKAGNAWLARLLETEINKRGK